MSAPTEARPVCLVIQDFGRRHDPYTGRVLDLDRSYELIRAAVESAGLECIRGDEITHGPVELVTCEYLLEAPLVIADLSAGSDNTFYELGLRHALRPRATIVIAEDQTADRLSGFDFQAWRYRHLGEDVGAEEARRFQGELVDTLSTALGGTETDSPVYAHFPDLQEPTGVASRFVESGEGGSDESLSALLAQAASARQESDWKTAKHALTRAREIDLTDVYVVQQLALATYKSARPDAQTALKEARELLETLSPTETRDPETLSLWGAVHKQLWEQKQERGAVDEAIRAFRTAFEVQSDPYFATNAALMLSVRAGLDDGGGSQADWREAREIRGKILELAEQRLSEAASAEDRFWLVAMLWEAAVGLEDEESAKRWEAEARSTTSADWMLEAALERTERVRKLVSNPPRGAAS